ncbi:GAF domain-containing protein [Leucobacter chromiireducens]|uniref:GAF domain-containing protein n=1 Tax=Leucobacter chromiireducens TaxID=283877 RepID=UPI003F806031
MPSSWQALQRGESVRERRRALERAHERFVSSAASAALHDPNAELELRERFAATPGVRPFVLDSWLRSQRGTIHPDRVLERPALDGAALDELRRIHPLSSVLPVIRKLLFDEARESGLIVAVGDSAGRLLWVDGDARLRTRAAEMGFRAGMDWSEHSVGTSAPGSAIELDQALQVLGAEHFSRAVHEWSCTAAPVHDPLSGEILGVVDVTGGDSAASPHLLPLLQATLAAIEAELQLARLRELLNPARASAAAAASGFAHAQVGPAAGHGADPDPDLELDPGPSAPRLCVLGREEATLEWEAGSAPLTGRHAEILLALAASPAGCSAEQLAEEVYGRADAEQTLRAELVRLRRWFAAEAVPLRLQSRPYALDGPLRVDASDALAQLDAGEHTAALAGYAGPVLPTSVSPVAERLRAELDATLRETMLERADPDQLFAYAQQWAWADAHIWETLLQVLPARSPRRAHVVAKLEALRGEQ